MEVEVFFLLIISALFLTAFILAIVKYIKATKRIESLTEKNSALTLECQRLCQAKEKLTISRDKVRKANQLKSDFIRNLGRELKEPIDAIAEYTNLILDCTDAYGKDYLSAYADIVSRNCKFLKTVTGDVFSLVDDNHEPILLKQQLVSLAELIDTSIETVRPSVKNGVSIGIKPGTEDISCIVDPRRLYQIMLHLLRNAVTFTERGSIIIDFGFSKVDNCVLISVADTGCGIDPDIVDRIFERGVVGRNATSGYGLGLSVSRLIVRMLGGDLSLDTSYNKGARFVLNIPYITKEQL